MKLFLAISLAAAAVHPALADDARLLLVSSRTTVKAHQPLALEIFLYNPSSKPVRAPALYNYSIESATMDATGKLSSGGSQSKGFTDLPSLQTLQPKSIQHKSIRVEIDVRPGDFAEVYVEIGQLQTLRSNSILLFCPKTNSPSH